MNNKKHIDRLFQEKLQGFEATPSDAVWENINAKLSLEKEKDRKVIPFWWKIAGIAAGLLLLITASNALFFNNNTSSIPENEVVNTENEKDADSDNLQQEKDNATDADKVIINNNLTNEDAIAIEEEAKDSNQNTTNVNSKNSTVSHQDSKSNAIVNASNTKNHSNVVSNRSQNFATESDQKGTVNQKQQLKNETISVQNLEKNAVAENNRPQKIKDRINDANQDNNTPQIDKDKVKELTNSVTENAVTDATNANEKDNGESAASETTPEDEKLSIQDELDRATEDKDVVDEEELNKKRWSVASNVAPVYFNAFGSGSSIDSKFDNSPKSGKINMSYGVAANYQVNDKLSIRAGVNQVKLGYNTNNVIVYNNVEADENDNGRPLKNVALNNESQNLSFLSSDGLSFGQVPDVVANNISSSIEQRLGFIEIPVEAEYKLTDKKLGLSLIGGFSTLFLNENQVYSTLQNERQLLGEATNVNKTSFSANLGVGVKYKVSEKINLNLEPVFKYQLNTFSDTSGSFNPYTIGVHTGFSFKF